MQAFAGTRPRPAVASILATLIACGLPANVRTARGEDAPVGASAGESYLSCGFPLGLEETWFRADYLVWQLEGSPLPALVTASPSGTPLSDAGRLDGPATEILAGGETVGDRLRSGFELSGGYWVDPYNGFALMGDYFYAGRDSYGLIAGPNSGRILARPYNDADPDPDQPSAAFVDVPTELAGTVVVKVFDNFQGVGGALEQRLLDTGDQLSYEQATLSAIAGYRYYQHDSLVQIGESLLVLPGTSTALVPGTQIALVDEFAASNRFHGAEFGVKAALRRDVWWIDGFALLAVGGSRRTVFVEGATVNAVPGAAAVLNQGGLLTSDATNIGRYTDSRTEIIPRLRLGVGARLTDWCSIQAGYNVIIWNNIVQAATHLPPNLAVDPDNIPPVLPGGGPDPAFPGMQSTDLVAHGLDVGFEVAF